MMTKKKEDSFEEIFSDFHFDIKRWKSLIGHMENEIVFLDRLLGSDVFDTVSTDTMREQNHLYKKRIKTKRDMIVDIKSEVTNHHGLLLGMPKGKNADRDNVFREQHGSLKDRFEKFCKEFNDFRARVLLQTGSVL
ncbi:hypothetical protein PY092_12845 [Muricauda sp. 334s03]|uniref:Uncharacterized protein n=2 Tax=Flagellimonas TaxID=444459 RepID=A0ABT5XPA8_9FLAO|nr:MULTISPECIES: hypothetical protein [Allomuricauda]MDF0707725.1 hypothetical protein [[Muricauda] okinawensis]MDF0717043.1 hypothetical protein [[Muricauda] yonaguniensis]